MKWFKLFSTKKKTNSEWIADVSIAGLQHYRGNDLGELIKLGDSVTLKHQPENQYDINAVLVLWQGNKIGYLPKEIATEVSEQINSGKKIQASIVELNSVCYGRKWLKIRLVIVK